MDTKRLPKELFHQRAQLAYDFVIEQNAELVVLADDNALRLLGSRLLKQQIPIVFLGINANPRRYVPLTNNVSGVLERPLMKRSIAMIKAVIPQVRKVKILMSDSVSSREIVKTSLGNRLSHSIGNIQVDTVISSTFSHWQQSTKGSQEQGYDAIILATYATLKNEVNNTLTVDYVTKWTSKNSPVPVFSFWSFSVGQGKAIGGLTISGQEQGVEAAKKVNLFYAGKQRPPITTPHRGSFIFSHAELRRWQLSLPPRLFKKAKFIE
ncbi:hypothetical protein CW748_12470 [Alteromonadales bacterium alter-6D02]|nr:hypothetical protein CW748_12470 [Alteromonadales bacterium alter-6D02]